MVNPNEGLAFARSCLEVEGDLDNELLGLDGDKLGVVVDFKDFFGDSLTLPSFEDNASLLGDFVGEGVLEIILMGLLSMSSATSCL